MAKKSGYLTFMEELPWALKIVFSLPILDILWGIYRIIKGANKNDIVLVVIGILWIIPFSVIGWILDLISSIVYKEPKWLI